MEQLQLSLRLSTNGVNYKAQIDLNEVGVSVSSVGMTIRSAFDGAVDKVSEELRAHGFDVSPEYIMGVLTEAMVADEGVPVASNTLN